MKRIISKTILIMSLAVAGWIWNGDHNAEIERFGCHGGGENWSSGNTTQLCRCGPTHNRQGSDAWGGRQPRRPREPGRPVVAGENRQWP